jgi:hypothetical protein
MTIRKHVGLDDYGFANYAFDGELAAINLRRDPFNCYTTSAIGDSRYFFHSCQPLTPNRALSFPHSLI